MFKKLIHNSGWSWYAASTPNWLRWIYPSLVWKKSIKTNTVFLTFDDGPIPEVTQFVLDTLKTYQAKATFFCIGKNVIENPNLYQQIINNGHAVGNHTQHHLNGWQTNTSQYLQNVIDAQKSIASKLFRPPYGRIKRNQIKQLQLKGFSIIMWDVLSGDFDTNIDGIKCTNNVIQNIKPGSIIVFHDSVKAYDRLKIALPNTLQWLQQNNYTTQILL
jgi:peptidoglycan/xylan/chitin deacetylase (PgdA/CDA1 family)